MTFLLLAAAVGVGLLLAVQASANQQLGKTVGTPFGAGLLQLALALAALVLAAAIGGQLLDPREVVDVRPAWLLLAGAASPLYIISGILLFPRLGALASVGLFVAGQVVASNVLDVTGWLSVPRESLGLARVLGTAAVLVGIGLVIRAQQTAALGSVVGVRRAGWLLLGLVAGAVLPVQATMNAELRSSLGHPLGVGALSFAVAVVTVALVVAGLRVSGRSHLPRTAGLARMPWWGWLGGLCAAAYVTASLLLIPRIGAATTVALTVTGQQLGSAVIDQVGGFRLPQRRVTGQRLVGLVALVAGAALVHAA